MPKPNDMFNTYSIRLIALFFMFTSPGLKAQVDEDYLRQHAVMIDRPERLSDSIYTQLSPFQLILMGEIHGSNESAPFVQGLTQLFLDKGDSVLLGLEIPPGQMALFLAQHTDSSLYASAFFASPAFKSGKESEAWAGLILTWKDDPRVHIFFYDVDNGEGESWERDRRMAAKIKEEVLRRPHWKMVALGGNYHNIIYEADNLYGWLKDDKDLRAAGKICALNMEYQRGAYRANFGEGLEEKEVGRKPTAVDTTLDRQSYFVLVSPNSGYAYQGYYYTEVITAAKMVAERKTGRQ